MNRADLLCTMSRVMMEAFSRRTVEGLKSYTLFRLALPPFQAFLNINVGKEVEKDRLVILRAAELHRSGTEPDPAHVAALLQQAREIDQTFVRKAATFPIDIRIQYRDIEHYRQQRIELLLQTSYRILTQWQGVSSFRAAVNKLYDEAQFRELLHDILRLYAMETRMLSRSVRIPHLLSLARDAVTRTITDVMERESEALAKSLAHVVYRRINPAGSGP
ncbi:hypothetical protein BMS3Bbin12_00534 [bacterium BMS3Bbin12]|nr:hypothetical protein BMS3Abin12_00578 [bacterium BMS3Abin12]GBE47375.1 hypothetical protein BMS3Bbin12_00534 [bacterium BMS3Bbin12]GBE50319.1 hypothetical protein BMS3Bbin13_01258 [bacterium BMS3Bbin13]HDJ85677.1 hypothetical protein [Chromatiales bacterium]